MTLTFVDNDHGSTDCRVHFDPPIEDGAELTPAQQNGMTIAKLLVDVGNPSSVENLDAEKLH